MIRKARDNLESAATLAAWRYPDAAANRLYYALYHAGWHFLVQSGRPVPIHDGKRYFWHKEMDRALDDEGFQGCLGLDSDWADYWEELHNLRVKADYYPDSVRLGDLDEASFRFVEQVVGEVSRLRGA